MSREDFDSSSSILVQDIMTRALIPINLSTAALQITKMMQQGGVDAILVQDHYHPVGIVTDGDFAIKLLQMTCILTPLLKKLCRLHLSL